MRLKGYSVSQRDLYLLIIGGSIAALLIYMLSIQSIVDMVDEQLRKSDEELVFSAIETGPLTFARQHSADFAQLQLQKFMSDSQVRQRNLLAAEIRTGSDKSSVYAQWSAPSLPSSTSCIHTISREYKSSDGLFPYFVSLSFDTCAAYAPTSQLIPQIVTAFLVLLLATAVSASFALLFLFDNIRKAASLIARHDADNHGSSTRDISYLPLRHLTEKALESIELQKFKSFAHAAQNLGHDLRAPLAMFERLLLTEPKDFVNMKTSLKQSLNRLHAMIDLLKSSDLEAKIVPREKDIDLASVFDILRVKAEKFGVAINLPSPHLQKVWVDEMAFERVLINLGVNAIEAAARSVRIELLASEEIDLLLRVIDDGPGVHPEQIPHLFKRGATHGKVGGNGLGLAYVEQVAKGHGGEARYRREGRESIFECIFPFAWQKNSEPLPLEISEVSQATPIKAARRKVALLLVPSELGAMSKAKLSAIEQDSCEFLESLSEDTDLVITNDVDRLEDLVQLGLQVIEFSPQLNLEQIVRRSLIRLGIKAVDSKVETFQNGRVEALIH